MPELGDASNYCKQLLENATYGLSALKAILDLIEGSGFATGTDSLKVLSDVLDDIKGSGFATGTDSLKILSDVLDAIEGSGFATGTDSLKVLSDVLDLIRTELTFQYQPSASLSQANPVQDIWYTVLNTTANVRLIKAQVMVATTGETIAMQITIDGQTISGSVAAVADTGYYPLLRPADEGIDLSWTDYQIYRSFLLEGRSIKVEVRKTTANGTGTLSAYVRYAKR